MSRIGKLPVPVPAGVKVEVSGHTVKVTGPKGTLERVFHADIDVSLEGQEILIKRPSDQRQHKALHGLTRALVNNMVVGVNQGFKKVLEIVGVGYRAAMRDKNLVLYVGHSHVIEIVPPPDVSFAIENRGQAITVSGVDKEVVGQVAADIRAWRPPEPYKGKGVRYESELVRRKAGKAGKAAS
ncbi:MAG: 50S ribosomal protein L6 [Anaerolineae bacterium]|nr:50S ribosomal protein L6 [Anaerolineae bacterium]